MNQEIIQADSTNNNAAFPRTPEAHQRAASRAKQTQESALVKAATGESTTNYKAILEGFAAKGIPMSEILPRKNVFTFNAWKALGRVVKKGESGVKVVTVIECTKKDESLGEIPVKKLRRTTVFHISQTQPIDAAAGKFDVEQAANTEAGQDETDAATLPAGEPPAAQDAAAARPLNAYEEKIAARKARYAYRAIGAHAAGNAALQRARSMASVIPFGQPILLDHYSARRDINYRNKIHNTFGKGFALHDKADYYERKAASVGTGGISSDDPDALQKLRQELKALEASQEKMKAANKAIRSHKTPESQKAALLALGFNDASADQLLTPDFCKRIGFASYSLTNNNANMRRVAQRIKELESRRARATVEQQEDGYTYREDTQENRVMFIFDGKPSKDVREVLKRHAFKWSPSRNAWVRQLNNAGLWSAAEVRKALAVSE